MDAPFDTKDLVAKLKAKGLPIVEEMAKDVEQALVAWVEESVALTPNKLDDLTIPLLMAIQPYVEAQIAKIAPPAP